jgi:hypothetical protein
MMILHCTSSWTRSPGDAPAPLHPRARSTRKARELGPDTLAVGIRVGPGARGGHEPSTHELSPAAAPRTAPPKAPASLPLGWAGPGRPVEDRSCRRDRGRPGEPRRESLTGPGKWREPHRRADSEWWAARPAPRVTSSRAAPPPRLGDRGRHNAGVGTPAEPVTAHWAQHRRRSGQAGRAPRRSEASGPAAPARRDPQHGQGTRCPCGRARRRAAGGRPRLGVGRARSRGDGPLRLARPRLGGYQIAGAGSTAAAAECIAGPRRERRDSRRGERRDLRGRSRARPQIDDSPSRGRR